MLSHGWIKQKT